MSLVKFKSRQQKSLVFCIVDRTHEIVDPWAKEIIKNQADKTIQQLYGLDFDVIVGTSEDKILQTVSEDYTHACVISTGTEFIGDKAIHEIENTYSDTTFLCGHILDRGDAYYELHQQFYIINLNAFKEIGKPFVGNSSLGESHTQICPVRSKENVHDDYVPYWVQPGIEVKEYKHKLHGWNIIRQGLNKYKLTTVPESIRNHKVYMYPESDKDLKLMLGKMYKRERLAVSNFIHKQNTETKNNLQNRLFDQVVIPASGTMYSENLMDDGDLVFYDYNPATINYWKTNEEFKNCKFIHADLLSEGFDSLDKFLDPSKSTLFNLSNIFSYEGTACLTPLSYRLYCENKVIEQIKNFNPDAFINFTARAGAPFLLNLTYVARAKDFEIVKISDLNQPTWHTTDWV